MIKQTDYRLPALTILADGAAIVAGFLLLPDLARRFATPGAWNVAAIMAVYFAFCAAVYWLRKLEPEEPARLPGWPPPRPLLVMLAVIFGLTLAALMLDQLGYWQAIFVVDDRILGAGESSAFFVYAPGAFIAISFFYILVLSGQVRQTILRRSRRYLFLALAGLLAVNGMTLLLAAILQSMNLAWWLIFPLLLLLFGPPRLWYLAKRPSIAPLLSFLILTLFYSLS